MDSDSASRSPLHIPIFRCCHILNPFDCEGFGYDFAWWLWQSWTSWEHKKWVVSEKVDKRIWFEGVVGKPF